MSLLKTRYLRRKRVLTLLVILTLTSTLFSVTAYSFLGFYNGFTNYAGEESDIIAVYSKTGGTPFSGIIPLSVADRVTAVEGVVAVSPEAIAPSTINDQSVFIRGVIPQDLNALNQLTILQGKSISFNNTDSCIVGKSLADRLQVNVGDNILAFSILSKRYVELQVVGVFQSGSSLNDEAIVPLYVGQWLRGISYDQVTLVRAQIDTSQTNSNLIYTEIANKTASSPAPSVTPSPTQKNDVQKQMEALIPLAQGNIKVGDIGIEESQQFMASYLDRYGISKDTLVILSVVVLVFASATAISAITLFVRQHSSDIDIIRAIGVSSRKIKTDLIVKMVIWSLIATALGTAVSAAVITAFQGLGYLQVLSHTIVFQLDPVVVAANFILLSVLIGLNIARMEFKQ